MRRVHSGAPLCRKGNQPAPVACRRYAMEAISNAGSCVGVLAKDGVVLAAEKKITSKVCGWGAG